MRECSAALAGFTQPRNRLLGHICSIAQQFNPQTKCCGYGTDGMQTSGYDCVLIPGALKATNTAIVGTENICGRSAGLVTVNGMTSTTVCSK